LDEEIWKGIRAVLDGIGDRDVQAPETLIEQAWNSIVLYALFTEWAPDAALHAHRYIGDTRRTDKQIGAGPSARGSTTLVEKPGIATLIGLAVENGAILQEESGTDVTLRTSPALLFRALYRESAANAEQTLAHDLLSRIGGFASFPTDDTADDGQELEELTAWGLQLDLNFWQSRLTRSRAFERQWRKEIEPEIRKRLLTVVGAMDLIVNETSLKRASQAALDRVFQSLTRTLPALRGARTAQEAGQDVRTHPAVVQVSDEIRDAIAVEIIDPIRNGDLAVPAEVRSTLTEVVLPELNASHAAAARINEELREKLDDLLLVPAFTLSYTNRKNVVGPNASDVRLVLQHKIDLTSLVLFPEPFELIWNADATFNHDSDVMMGEETVRAFGGSLAAQFSFANRLSAAFTRLDASPITATVAGRFGRFEAQEDEVGVIQGRVEIPIVAGISFPISLTYATRTEEVDEDEVRGNFGFTFDADKLYGLAMAAMLLE
jgi:hypothetical protein